MNLESNDTRRWIFQNLPKKVVIKEERNQSIKKAYVAWDDNEVSSSSDSESDESINLTLMVSHYSDDKEKEVSNKNNFLIIMMHKEK